MRSAPVQLFFSQGLSSGSSLSITAALLFIPTADKRKNKPTTLLEFSENKRVGRGAWNLFRCQGQNYILLGLETEGKRKKVNFKTIIEAKPKPASPSVYCFTGGASLSHVSGLIIFLKYSE